MFRFCRTEHKYWEMNDAHISLNEFIDHLGSLLNQARAGPFRLVGNTLHKTAEKDAKYGMEAAPNG